MSSKVLISLLLSALWIGAVAYFALQSWPQMSLDLGKDAGTLAAYDQAVFRHAGYFALIALAPPLLALFVARLFASR